MNLSRVCMRRKLKVNISMNNIVVFERAREETIYFEKPFRVKTNSLSECHNLVR